MKSNIYLLIKGLSIGDSKPDFNTFIKPIVRTLKKLEFGFQVINLNKDIKTYHCFLLYGIFDKPARALANNLINSNGYYGCCKCLQEGSRFKFQKSKALFITNNGKI